MSSGDIHFCSGECALDVSNIVREHLLTRRLAGEDLSHECEGIFYEGFMSHCYKERDKVRESTQLIDEA